MGVQALQGSKLAGYAARHKIDSNQRRVEQHNVTDHINPGICANCMHMTVIRSDRGVIFYRCLLSDQDQRFPKYPRLPVRVCTGWAEDSKGSANFDDIED